mmetsp:Transcript_3889/g.12077  ORF Transcript_3889/g.12077 Transcript_3889/m.12077 type:complete len:234 (+) Transcript_3889:102-803(+)
MSTSRRSYRRNRNPERTCAGWVAAKPSIRCADEELIECPVTCGACPATPSDVPTDLPRVCDGDCCDSTSFLLGGDASRDCNWVSLKADIRCRNSAEDECRVSCGTCDSVGELTDAPADAPTDRPCVDAMSWTITLSSGKIEDCSWVAKQPAKRCKRGSGQQKAKRNCLESCGECGTDAPTEQPTDAIVCKDNMSFRKNGKESKDCSWVDDSTSRRCVGDALNECRVTCDSCPS